MSKPAHPSPRTRRPRGSLTPEVILDAAEHVARNGFDLSMRAVAAELAAAPMALYRHFSTKEELVNALLDRVLGRFEPEPPSGDVVEDVRRFAHAHRRLLDRHPWALAPLFSHPNPGPNAIRIGELALGPLRRAGLSDEQAVATFSGLIALNYGWSSFAAARRATPAAGESARQALAALPAADYPLTLAVADEMADYASDRHYELVLDQILLGVSSASSAVRLRGDHSKRRKR